MPDVRYVLSRHLARLELDDAHTLVSHALLGHRRVLPRRAVVFLDQFCAPRSVAEAVAAAAMAAPPGTDEGEWRSLLAVFVRDLVDAGLLVVAGSDEEAELRESLRRRWARDGEGMVLLGALAAGYEPVLVSAPQDAPAPTGEEVRFLLLGWCFTQSTRPLLAAEAALRGLTARVEVAFPDDVALIGKHRPDVTVLQLGHRFMLAPLLDGFDQIGAAERQARIDATCARVRSAVADAQSQLVSGLLLVQGVAAPQTSPLGWREHRDPPGVGAALAAFNGAAAAAAATRSDTVFVDEEALLSAHGKRALLDDLVAPYSHHGAHGGVAAQRLLARAYLDCYEAWLGRGAIRCVAVDLDGTLWPGEVGDPSFTFESEAMAGALLYGRHGGLHQALKILRARGILLAVCSRNAEADVLSKWRVQDVPIPVGTGAADAAHYLAPGDFVRLKIGWARKSQLLRELCDELAIAPDQLAFIDDNPIERAEVRHHLPGVLVLGDDMAAVREVLLTSPRFAALGSTDEARRRDETTRARLAREASRAVAADPVAFLRELEVRCSLNIERDRRRASRISELLRRTTQLNTTGLAPSAEDVARLIEGGGGGVVLTLHVRDRYADHGVVGVAIIDGARLSAFALSCRVIGLEVERALLRRVLEVAREGGPVLIAPFVPNGERNLPAARLFAVPGFVPLPDGSGYAFDFRQSELPPWPAHCTEVEP